MGSGEIMKIKISSIVHYYYTFVLLSLITALGLGIYTYWFDGPANVENINAIFEASILVDNFKKRDDLKVISSKINSDQATEAVKSIILFQNDLQQINRIVAKQSEYEEITKGVAALKSSMNNVISLADLSTVMNVMLTKIEEFEQMVSSNNWRTLTRIAGRLKAQLSIKKVPGAELYNLNRLRLLNRNLNSEIKSIKEVTESSVLSRPNKDMIISKIASVDVELSMLGKYLEEMDRFNNTLGSLRAKYSTWVQKISPDIDDKRALLEERSQMLLLILSGIVGFALLSAFLGFILNRQSAKNIRRAVEANFIQVVSEGLIPTKDIEMNFDKKFSLEFAKLKDYLHKRMSFGSYFQDALPFPALLLDHNLSLAWGNPLFYEIWNLEKVKNSSTTITWDFLQQFTNLGEDDPIILALRDKIAGIYQIQIKAKNKDQNIPYEMYVSPIEHSGVTRVMIFLYPLVSLEETIANQTKSIVGPVSRMLDSLISKNLDQVSKDKMGKDFDVAGIKKVFEKFCLLNEKSENERGLILQKVAQLTEQLADKTKLVQSAGEISQNLLQEAADVFKTLGNVKGSIISVVEIRNEIETLFQSTVRIIKQVVGDKKTVLDSVAKSRQVISETVSSLDKVKAGRDAIKKQKANFDASLSKMVQRTNEMLISEKTDDAVSYRVKEVLTSFRQEMKGLDALGRKISDEMVNLDVGISKIEMINGGFVVPDFKHGRDEFNSANGLVESASKDMSELSIEGQKEDEKLIDTLKDLVAKLTKISEEISFAKGLLEIEKENRPEVLEVNELSIPSAQQLTNVTLEGVVNLQ